MRKNRKVAAQENFRWSKEEQRQDYPGRYRKILSECGCSVGGVTRALIRCFIHEAEGRGYPLYHGAAKKVADIIERKAKQKRSRRKRH